MLRNFGVEVIFLAKNKKFLVHCLTVKSAVLYFYICQLSTKKINYASLELCGVRGSLKRDKTREEINTGPAPLAFLRGCRLFYYN